MENYNPNFSRIMKQIFPKLVMIAAMLLSFLPASAYDLGDGVLYYNFIYGTNDEVEVTSRGKYSGDINIPSTVTTNNGKTKYTVTAIGVGAFRECTGLTSITIPNSVTYIRNSAFLGCTGLTSVTIPSAVTYIGDSAFLGCTGLTSVTIPNSVTSIKMGAFNGCTGLAEINVEPKNRYYASIDGVLLNKSLTEIIRCPEGKTGTFSIPSSVTSIGANAFISCAGLTSVTIPNSVTSIGNLAFYGCDGLTSVTIPNSVTSIGTSAFYDCDGLTSIAIPNSVTAIGTEAFYNCDLLRSVYCYWDEPLECDYSWFVHSLFSSYTYETGTLYVPKGCADNYKSTVPWKYFRNIEEADFSGVEDIIENQLTGDYIVYDFQGTLRLKTTYIDEVNQLPAGLYIINGKKVLIR